MGKTINQKMIELENLVKKYIVIWNEMQKQMEETKINKPYSKVQQPIRMGNADWVFHDGYWKIYAVYKDEEEEE